MSKTIILIVEKQKSYYYGVPYSQPSCELNTHLRIPVYKCVCTTHT